MAKDPDGVIAKTVQYFPRSYRGLLERIFNDGDDVSPRGIRTKELLNATLILKNPLDRIVMDLSRHVNFGFMVAEWLSFMTGFDDIKLFTAHISDYDRFSSDGKRLSNSYGSRVNASMPSQIEQVVDKLRQDRDSRQAVVTIFDGTKDVFTEEPHVPCTLSMQFLVRGGCLVTIVNMRSNDAFLGLPYDCFVFTMVQEWVATKLNISLGHYIHNAGSLHFYEENFKYLDTRPSPRWPRVMQNMPPITMQELNNAVGIMMNLQVEPQEFVSSCIGSIGQYVTDLVAGSRAYALRKTHRHWSRLAYYMIQDQTVRKAVYGSLKHHGVL